MEHPEMVERVAKVLIAWGHTDDSWGAARAVIDCMREPTAGMIDAGLFDSEGFNRLGVHRGDFVRAYTRMIGEALRK